MRILAFAYACEPDKGSEPGAGWMWSRMLARLGEVWVITRANNRQSIEKALSSTPEASNLHFIYVDLPAWARRWKQGQRGVHAYYLLWQLAALRKAKQVVDDIDPELVWHVTMANVWLGSAAPFLGRRAVFGPVGGGVTPPWRLTAELGARGAAHELSRVAARSVARLLNPLARGAWARSALILALNPETRDWLPSRYRAKTAVLPNAILEDGAFNPSSMSSDRAKRTAVFAGRLLPLKGVSLAIRAVAATSDWRLTVIGSGPDLARLQRLVRSLGVDDRVAFAGQVSRDTVLNFMRHAEVFIFPSLHDESPFVVAEAIACGCRVICLNRGGAPLITSGTEATALLDGMSRNAIVEGIRLILEAGTEDPLPSSGKTLEHLSLEGLTDAVSDLLVSMRVVA